MFDNITPEIQILTSIYIFLLLPTLFGNDFMRLHQLGLIFPSKATKNRIVFHIDSMSNFDNLFNLNELSLCKFERYWDNGTKVIHSCGGKVVLRHRDRGIRTTVGYILGSIDTVTWDILLMRNNKRIRLKKLMFNN